MRERTPGRSCLLGLLAIVLGCSFAALPGPAASSPPVEQEEAHAASRLAVAGLVGSLQVERHDGAEIRLVLRGSAAALGRVRREVRGDLLQVTVAPAPAGTGSVVSASNNRVVALGGRATLNVGSAGLSVEGAAEPPLELRAYVPAATPLAIRGLIGDLSVQGVGGPLEVELVGGQAHLDRATGGRLAVVGGSRIELALATGDLTIAIQGAGEVVVADAALNRLEIALSGAGNVTVGGTAEQASVQIAGVGNVAVDAVRERPRISLLGIGQVAIGNW
jgi:Putative auto-transporter adhesin, head GIN domain